MKRWMLVLAALAMCWNLNARADVTFDFIRYTCVPENGMIDIEYRGLHDTVAGIGSDDPAEGPKVLRQHDFYRARGFQATCTIGQATYVIAARQDAPSERMCGGAPEVYLDVTRNGKLLFHDVVFGEQSCNDMPSLQRFTIGEITPSWRESGPEVQACYSAGRPATYAPGREPQHICNWTFGNADVAKRFPVDEDAIRQMFAPQQK